MDQICLSEEAVTRLASLKGVQIENEDLTGYFNLKVFRSTETMPERQIEAGDVILMVYCDPPATEEDPPAVN